MGTRSRIRLQACTLCDAVTRTGYYYHAERPGHGIDGWESDQPLCLSCTQLMISGKEGCPITHTKKGGRKKCE